jgi:tungstate transport system substrate-binding protein
LTHAPELEEKFVAAGWGTRRLPVMVNDYVLAGPADDPAGVCGTTAVVTALQKIAASASIFVSRSDLSGTNMLEMKLWREAGTAPAGEPWYRECRSVLGSYGGLQQASEMQAYTLVDRASFLAGHGGTALKICLEGDRLLVNVFSVLPVSALKTGVDQEGAEQFADWLTGRTAQSIIAGFGRHNFGCSLFEPVNLSRQTA